MNGATWHTELLRTLEPNYCRHLYRAGQTTAPIQIMFEIYQRDYEAQLRERRYAVEHYEHANTYGPTIR